VVQSCVIEAPNCAVAAQMAPLRDARRAVGARLMGVRFRTVSFDRPRPWRPKQAAPSLKIGGPSKRSRSDERQGFKRYSTAIGIW